MSRVLTALLSRPLTCSAVCALCSSWVSFREYRQCSQLFSQWQVPPSISILTYFAEVWFRSPSQLLFVRVSVKLPILDFSARLLFFVSWRGWFILSIIFFYFPLRPVTLYTKTMRTIHQHRSTSLPADMSTVYKPARSSPCFRRHL